MPNPQSPLRKIISGGWCPKGRIAEDGKIPARYPLQENSTTSYAARTWLNIDDADAALVVTFGEPRGGLANMLARVASCCRPSLHIDAHKQTAVEAADEVTQWIIEHHIRTLNTAGPRASKEPAIYIYVYDLTKHVLSSV